MSTILMIMCANLMPKQVCEPPPKGRKPKGCGFFELLNLNGMERTVSLVGQNVMTLMGNQSFVVVCSL